MKRPTHHLIAMLLAVGCLAPAAAQAQQADAAEGDMATITGILQYPSDHIPPDIEICAEHVHSGRTTCTSEHIIDDQQRTRYSLDVPPGDYHVYARLTAEESFSTGFDDSYRAYYSQFVACGYMATCRSHEPIMIAVKAGETVRGVDPNDWYRQD